MTTMKTRALLFGIALGAIALSSCSNDDNTKDQKEETQGVHFTIIEEGFGADTELTRATPSTQPQIIEAGDCEAEISIERAPAEKLVATRGVTTPVHYTIRAYHNGTLRGEMKGTFTPTGFTPDAGYSAQMELGRNRTYDFVCFNDKVTPNGNNLDVTLANAKDARIGRQSIAIGTTDQTINLSSKHVGCRIQTKMLCQKHMPATTATLGSHGATVPQTVSYDPATDTYTATNGSLALEANNSPASTETIYSASNFGQTYAYTSACPDYHYVLPTTDAKNLQLNFTGGTLFWKPLNSSMPGLSATSTPLVANGSYTIKIKMKPNYTYLMSDGSTGFYKETTQGGGTKTPIAVVIDKNKKMAVALQSANKYSGPYTHVWAAPYYAYAGYLTINTHCIMNPSDYAKALTTEATSGKEETWNAAYSTSNVRGDKVKAKNVDFPPFKACADYGSDIAYVGSPQLTWYLPSHSDFKILYDNLGFGDKNATIEVVRHYLPTAIVYSWYGNLLEQAFTEVGGTMFTPDMLWSSTEFGSSTEHFGGLMILRKEGIRWTLFTYHNEITLARPFVAY